MSDHRVSDRMRKQRKLVNLASKPGGAPTTRKALRTLIIAKQDIAFAKVLGGTKPKKKKATKSPTGVPKLRPRGAGPSGFVDRKLQERDLTKPGF